ncbi:MAG: hypothetical protein E7293_03425 [Lachnospiraceae bacterium]|nr:hypothetical protein [Lachnospiraceae bacterium]
MDLRPINPYYKQKMTTFSVRSLRGPADAGGYSYPYDWILPVIDRSQADVDYAKVLLALQWDAMTVEQQQDYNRGLKGCINRSDFERIENNIQILLDVLEIPSTSYVDNVPEFVTASYFETMKENIAAIRSGYVVHADTPPVPELPYNTWQKYNDVEKILADVYEVLCAQFHYYTGNEVYAGDDTGLLL